MTLLFNKRGKEKSLKWIRTKTSVPRIPAKPEDRLFTMTSLEKTPQTAGAANAVLTKRAVKSRMAKKAGISIPAFYYTVVLYGIS